MIQNCFDENLNLIGFEYNCILQNLINYISPTGFSITSVRKLNKLASLNDQQSNQKTIIEIQSVVMLYLKLQYIL